MRSHPVLPSLLLGFALLAATPLQAGVNRWTSIGPDGGGVTALAFSANGRTAWAATNGLGVFRSDDAGLHWTATNTGLPSLPDVSHRVGAALVATEPTEPAAVWAAIP